MVVRTRGERAACATSGWDGFESGTVMTPRGRHTRWRRLKPLSLWIVVGSCLTMISACRQRGELPTYLGTEHSADYLDRATQIAYTDLEGPVSSKVNFAVPPRRIRDRTKDEIWDLSLAEAIQTALLNSHVIRSSGQFLSPGNPILANPQFVQSVFDPAIQESGVLFGQRGVEAALSDFDTQFTTQLLYGQNNTIQNNTIALGRLAGTVLQESTDSFNASFFKRLATGGQLTLAHSVVRTGRNIPAGPGEPQLFPSVYEGATSLQFRQPLLAGGGVEYTRIAGPISENIQGVTGVQQGVVIARIENDMELAEFEQAVQQLVHDVEELYWRLHLDYITFDLQSRIEEMANQSFQVAEAKRQAGTGPGGRTELNLRSIYLDTKAEVDRARNSIYSTEAQLRRLMGLPVNDGRVIRPIDEPITAEFVPSWEVAMSDALVKRPEVRRQKWSIRSFELQLRAAENLLMPRLDFVSGYRINGFGDELFGRGDSGPQIPPAVENYYQSMLNAGQTGWNVGVEFSVPIGRRFAKTQVQSLELQLAKARAVLAEQEVELSHEVADSFRTIDLAYEESRNSYNQYLAAEEARKLAFAQFRYAIDNDPELEPLLRAEMRVAESEVNLARSITQYNVALADLSFRTGQTLRASSIELIEGCWNPEAYIDAEENFEARKYAKPAPNLITKPMVYPDYSVIE